MNDQSPKAQTNLGHWDFLLVLIAFLLPSYVIRFSFFSIPTNLLEVGIGAIFIWGLLQPDVRKSWRAALKNLPRPILYSTFYFLVSAVVSTAISPHFSTSLGILKGWIITPLLYGFMVYAACHTSSASQRRVGFSLLRRSASPYEGEAGLWPGEVNVSIARALILSGLTIALFSFSQLGLLDRIRGPFDVPNSLALFLAPLIILSIFHIPYSKFSRLAAFTMFFALLFTQSIAGVLSVLIVVGLSLCFGFWKLKPVWILCFGLCALSATLILWPKVNYLIRPASSAHVRLQLWSISWELIKGHPLLGLGLGDFEPAYQAKLHERFQQFENCNNENSMKIENCKLKIQTPPLPEFVFRDPHNWILSFWLNLGVLGLVSFVFLHTYIFYWSFRHWGLIGHWSLVIGILGALSALLIFGLFDTIFWKNDLAILHWLLLAIAISGIIKA